VSASPDLNASPTTPLERLGSTLREARLSRGIERATLAAQLHMGEEQLQALEEANTGRLPELVFVIAQSRRVARALELEIDPLIAPLKQSGAGIQPAPAPPQPIAAPQQPGLQSHIWPWLSALVLLAAVSGAGVWGWSLIGRRGSVSRQPPAPALAAPAAAVPAASSLRLSSPEPSWLTVEDASGKTLYEGLFNGSRSFPIGAGLKVRAGRPDLVRASLDSGPTKPLGRIDQITWVRFGAAAPAPAP
jgi:transcriptional regulator with XRE-family HTH domain